MEKSNLELIESLLSEATALSYADGNRQEVVRRGEMLVRRIFGVQTHYLTDLKSIRFTPMITSRSTNDASYQRSFQSGRKQLITLCKVMKEDLELDVNSAIQTSTNILSPDAHTKVFLVHGHNTEVLKDVARTIQQLKLEPIILSEQANKGKTVIEKFVANSDVAFAVVMLTDDDLGRGKNETDLKNRARQNVLLELGYFIGRLGRERVMALASEGIEIPSDLHGIVYTPIDKHGAWKYRLVKELQAIGYIVDANLIT